MSLKELWLACCKGKRKCREVDQIHLQKWDGAGGGIKPEEFQMGKSNKVQDRTVVQAPPRSLIRPDNNAYQTWDGFISTTCLLVTLTVTFQSSFNSKIMPLIILSYIFDALFAIDTLIRFYVGYMVKGALVMDRKSIQMRYAKGEFILALLSLLPLELFHFAVSASTVPWYHGIRLYRLNRVLRFYRIAQFFGK